ncbi:MAG: hypothetical protein AMXMBFR83_06060 [Phycisphaerae bacterium]
MAGVTPKRATVITAESAGVSPGFAPRALQLNDVIEEARRALEQARQESARLVAETRARGRAEIEALREAELRKAREEGYRAGYEQGVREGRETAYTQALAEARQSFAEQQAGLVSACRGMLETIERDRADWLARARQDLIDLAMAIARRVARHVGQRDRDVVLANLEEAVRLVGARSEVTIAVNPADVEAARVFADSLLDLKEHWRNVHVVAESEIDPGGCRVQWSGGAVDATLETQLDRIAEDLKGT